MLSRVMSSATSVATRGASFFINLASVDAPTANTEGTPDTQTTVSTDPQPPFVLNLQVVSKVMIQVPSLRMEPLRYSWVAAHICAIATVYARIALKVQGGFQAAKSLGMKIGLLAIGRPNERRSLMNDLAKAGGTIAPARRALTYEPRNLIEKVSMGNAKLTSAGLTIENIAFLITESITQAPALTMLVELRIIEVGTYAVTSDFAAFILEQSTRPGVAPLSTVGDGDGIDDDSGDGDCSGDGLGAGIGGGTPRDDVILKQLELLQELQETRHEENLAAQENYYQLSERSRAGIKTSVSSLADEMLAESIKKAERGVKKAERELDAMKEKSVLQRDQKERDEALAFQLQDTHQSVLALGALRAVHSARGPNASAPMPNPNRANTARAGAPGVRRNGAAGRSMPVVAEPASPPVVAPVPPPMSVSPNAPSPIGPLDTFLEPDRVEEFGEGVGFSPIQATVAGEDWPADEPTAPPPTAMGRRGRAGRQPTSTGRSTAARSQPPPARGTVRGAARGAARGASRATVGGRARVSRPGVAQV